MCVVFVFYSHLDFGMKQASKYKTFKINVPEDLNYDGVFEEVFKKYAQSYELVRVKTVNLGSMFRLTYDVVLKDAKCEKELIDEIRCRNGNLEIVVSKMETANSEL